MQNAKSEIRQCPYCLGEFSDAEMTDDHVIARSWFPANTPPVAKWKVRCCQTCNNEKSALERDVLGRLALCVDPNDPNLAEIITKARRAMDPRSARTAHELKHRFNRREAIRGSIVDIRSKTDPGVLPYFVDNYRRRLAYGNIGACTVFGWAGSEMGSWHPSVRDQAAHSQRIRGIVIHADDQLRTQAFSAVTEHAKIVQKGPGVEVKICMGRERWLASATRPARAVQTRSPRLRWWRIA